MARVIAQHQITDVERFFGLTDEVTDTPDGLRVLQFCPSQDRTQAVCLWEAPSVEALEEYIASVPGTDGASKNMYFEVGEEYAFGLPEQAATSA